MKRILNILFVPVLVMLWLPLASQNTAPAKNKTKLEIFYFHPAERCPIDQSIEETTRRMLKSEFGRELRDGTIRFEVINTEDRKNAKTVGKFEINAQALYLVSSVNGKEVKNDLTEFAFSNCQSNPGKFKAGLRQEILKAIK